MKPHTPAIKQYLQIKAQYPDAILFFRMGDFYEMFFEDAKIGSKELDIALTSRDKGAKDPIPLCGVPYHAAESYISKLLQKGFKVALCEQVEDPKLAKGIVRREVVRVFTPGLLTEAAYLGTGASNYLMGFCADEEVFGLSFIEISTGEFRACQIVGVEPFLNEASRNEPKEILSWRSFENHPCFSRFRKAFEGRMITYLEDSKRERLQDLPALREQFPQVMERIDRDPLAALAAEMVLHYAAESQKTALTHLRSLFFYKVQDFMGIDETTKKNLELTESLGGGGKKGSLLGVLDQTVTAMGSRRLRQWLHYPLMDVQKINERLQSVGELKEKKIERKDLREALREVQDLERLTSRIFLGHANARDLLGLKRSLLKMPDLRKILEPLETPMLRALFLEIEAFPDLFELLDSSIVEDPPFSLREGGIIKAGYDEELDALRAVSKEGRSWILKLEEEERRKTGIPSLKVRYNQVFGYYIEVTKSHFHLVPDRYMRKQTLVNAERFITPELKEFEEKVLGAQEKICQLEYQIFERIRRQVAEATPRLQRTASAVANLDVLCALAEAADRYDYVRPEIDEGDAVIIRDGRHPVLEQMALEERFVPNDAELDTKEKQIVILTGPNMAGKSTYLRQVALIILMAQSGSFVPAREARIGLVDRIFTRIGASDNIAMGRSTFMVEMMETARILSQATSKSLVVLDEIGRGTSTFDGLSIAWAVVEYLHDNPPSRRPKTLFATHYHELTELALTKERVKNYNVAVREWGGEIIFLRKIVEGGTNRSYGIQVARLAGLPDPVIERAREILSNLERSELDARGLPRIAKTTRSVAKPVESLQLSLFSRPDPLRSELKRLKIEQLTPLDALNILNELKKKAESVGES